MPEPASEPLLLETIRIEGGSALHLDYHNQRFNHARKTLFSINKTMDLADFITPPKENSGTLYRCRILYSRKILKVDYIPYTPKIIKKISLINSNISYPFKFADRSELNHLLASSPGSDEVLIVKEGLLADTTIANIAFLEKGKWITPKKPLLEGTTRKRLIDEGFLIPKTIRSDEIDRFDGFALMNAMIGFKILNPICWGTTEDP
ncbi:MAG: aminotransferase class IV [Campylobacterota bacterium]|nr:aminotransferase class IV [Campylobacterota bacterium]